MTANVEATKPVSGEKINQTKRAAPPLLPNLDAFPETGYSRWRDLVPFVRFSREWVRQNEAAGRFPRGVRVSPNLVVWKNSEIKLWLADPMGYRAENQ